MVEEPSFDWDETKNGLNQEKYGVAFEIAQLAFLDENRIIAEDSTHGGKERRYYCFGWVHDGVMTVRFTWRSGRIRIFGAGYWRKGKRIYDRENQAIHDRRDRGSEGD
jgi:uncharacterized DUF497 family protein